LRYVDSAGKTGATFHFLLCKMSEIGKNRIWKNVPLSLFGARIN